MKEKLNIAILESLKAHEYRIPIHPQHFACLAASQNSKNRLFFQHGYARHFMKIKAYRQQKFPFAMAPRNTLLACADVIFLLKPLLIDLQKMKRGATLIAWCHSVQQLAMTRIARQKGLTLIAMEAMSNTSQPSPQHLFYQNNYTAGVLGASHALEATPIDYPKNAKVCIVGYGAVSQGAASIFLTKNFSNITVFSRRSSTLIANKLAGIDYRTMPVSEQMLFFKHSEALKEVMLTSDIIINGMMQDVTCPYYLLFQHDLQQVAGKLIIDLSCDDRMGFDFACATSMSKPIMQVENNFYYAVDHVPTLAWQVISYVISKQLLPLVNGFLSGRFDLSLAALLRDATDIENGIIKNKAILAYQRLFFVKSAWCYLSLFSRQNKLGQQKSQWPDILWQINADSLPKMSCYWHALCGKKAG